MNINVIFNDTFISNESYFYDVNSTLPTIGKYLVDNLGPQSLALSIAIPLTVINVIIFITGILGNVAVCVVIIKHSSMHTATNYYLFNLAVSDLTLLVFGLPNEIALYWHQYPWTLGIGLCKIRALLSEMASYVSVLTIVAFSTERYFSICHPLYLYTVSGFRRAVKIIAILWIISFFGALPFSIYTDIHYLEYPPNSTIILQESAFCGMLFQPEYLPLHELSTVFFLIIPMVILVYQYTMMGIKISKRNRLTFGQNGKRSFHRDRKKSQSHKSIIRMLAAVVLAFFICWAPFHAQRLLFIYAQNNQYFKIINEWMFFITGIMYYLSSTLNPILYNVMSNKYRAAFKETIFGIKSEKILKRNSTRESKIQSHSIFNEPIHKCSQSENGERDAKDETMILLHDRHLEISSPRGKHSLIYQINYNPTVNKPNSETCI